MKRYIKMKRYIRKFEEKKKEIQVPDTNLYIVGLGKDTNGNKVIKVNTPNERATAIQTNQNLPSIHRVNSIEDIDEKGFKELTDYINNYATGNLKKKFKEY
jgi:hypothetical protein